MDLLFRKHKLNICRFFVFFFNVKNKSVLFLKYNVIDFVNKLYIFNIIKIFFFVKTSVTSNILFTYTLIPSFSGRGKMYLSTNVLPLKK